MTKYFSIQDLSIAKEILATSDKIDHRSGRNIWTEGNLEWARNVVKFYSDLYNKARSFVGDWCARVKLAWAYVKGLIVDKIVKAIRKEFRNFESVVLPNGDIYLKDTKVHSYGTMRAKVKRFFTSK